MNGTNPAWDRARFPVVLVVEDEAVIRAILAEELEDAGFTVVEADGADAATAVLAGRSDIGTVVTDLRMPGSMDGLGLARWMRKHAPTVPIIITSGFATQPDVAANNPAIVRVVAKPYSCRDVAGWVAALVGGTCTAEGARR